MRSAASLSTPYSATEARRLVASTNSVTAPQPTFYIAKLAQSLFVLHNRNMMFMHNWVMQPLAEREKSSQYARKVKEREKQRRLARLAQRKRALLHSSDMPVTKIIDKQRKTLVSALVSAGSAAAGRRLMRSKAALQTAVSSMSNSANAVASSSIINDIVEMFVVLLMQPIHFTIDVRETGEMRVYPFGKEKFEQLYVPGTLLTGEELMHVQYLGMTGDSWINCEDYEFTARGECMEGGDAANDAFEIALDRVALVAALVNVIMYYVGIFGQQIIEASIMALAGRVEIIEAGYYNGLKGLVHSIRTQAYVRAPPDADHYARAEEFAVRYNVFRVFGDTYMKETIARDRRDVADAT